MSKRKALILSLVFSVFIFGACMVEAATNKAADACFTKKITSMKDSGKYTSILYKFADITGDDLHEALILAHPKNGGSASAFRILQYDNGKLNSLLSYNIYGLSRIITYKENGTFILFTEGHGGKSYRSFEMKKQIYNLVASKSAGSSGPWTYYNRDDKKISKSEYNKLVKGIKSGKRVTLNVDKWKAA